MKKQPEFTSKHWCAHLEEADETYSHHLLFTVRLGTYILVTGLILLVHGLLPFTFTKTASGRIEKIYLKLKSRIKDDRRKVIEADWDI
jgi:hypothetical protein